MVEIYSTTNCHKCAEAKEFMTANGIEFIEHNLSEDKVARDEMVSVTGQRSVPVFKIGETWYIGFNGELLKEKASLA